MVIATNFRSNLHLLLGEDANPEIRSGGKNKSRSLELLKVKKKG